MIEQDFRVGRLRDKRALKVLVPQVADRRVVHEYELCVGTIVDVPGGLCSRSAQLARHCAEGSLSSFTEIDRVVGAEDFPARGGQNWAAVEPAVDVALDVEQVGRMLHTSSRISTRRRGATARPQARRMAMHTRRLRPRQASWSLAGRSAIRAAGPTISRRKQIWSFARHLGEMCVPMCIGFAIGRSPLLLGGRPNSALLAAG
jgi:hypothetical protein